MSCTRQSAMAYRNVEYLLYHVIGGDVMYL